MSKTPTPRTRSETLTPTPITKRSRLPPSARTPFTQNPRTPASSLSVKSVVLSDWWLVDDEGKGLAVAGLANRENLGSRIFCSSAIVKRHDATTLETADGIVITISGFINESRSLQNGIPHHICNYFLLGFPYFWEEYAAKFRSKQSTNRDESIKNSSSSGSTVEQIFSDDLDNLSATRIRDYLIRPLLDSQNFTLDDILGEKCSNDRKHTPRSEYSKRENQTSVTTTKHSQDETPRDRKNNMIDSAGFTLDDILGEEYNNNHKHTPRSKYSKPENQTSVTRTKCSQDESARDRKKDRSDQKHRDMEGNSNVDGEWITPRIGVVTRSMSRLRNFKYDGM